LTPASRIKPPAQINEDIREWSYCVESGRSIDELMTKVNDGCLENGYEPIGGVSAIVVDGKPEYLQAVIRKGKKP